MRMLSQLAWEHPGGGRGEDGRGGQEVVRGTKEPPPASPLKPSSAEFLAQHSLSPCPEPGNGGLP